MSFMDNKAAEKENAIARKKSLASDKLPDAIISTDNKAPDAIIVGIVVSVKGVVIDKHLVKPRAFKNLVLDLHLFFLSLNPSQKSVVNNLSKVCKRIL